MASGCVSNLRRTHLALIQDEEGNHPIDRHLPGRGSSRIYLRVWHLSSFAPFGLKKTGRLMKSCRFTPRTVTRSRAERRPDRWDHSTGWMFSLPNNKLCAVSHTSSRRTEIYWGQVLTGPARAEKHRERSEPSSFRQSTLTGQTISCQLTVPNSNACR